MALRNMNPLQFRRQRNAPEGRLFRGFELPRPRPGAAEMEGNRRLMSGQGAPTRPSWDMPKYHRWDPVTGWWHGEGKPQKLFE